MDNFEKLNSLNEEYKRNIKLYYVFGFEGCNTIILSKDDRVFVFGDNRDGILGLGHDHPIDVPTIVGELCEKQIINFSSGKSHMIALCKFGKVYSWGRNMNGQIGNGKRDDLLNRPALIFFLIDKVIVQISCSSWYSLALAKTGEVYAWGYQRSVMLFPTCLKEFGGEKVFLISCGINHSMVLTSSGKVFCLRLYLEKSSRTEEKDYEYFLLPEPIQVFDINMTNILIKQISCASFHSLFLSCEGDIYLIQGYGMHSNELVIRKQMNPKCIERDNRNKFIDIATHYSQGISAALTENGVYHVWIENEHNILYHEETSFRSFEEVFCHYCGITFNSTHTDDYNLPIGVCMKNGVFERSFREICIVSTGHYGIVCKAINKSNNKVFAIKKIPLNEIQKENVCKEPLIMSKLKSEHIANFYYAWIENNYLIGNNDTHTENRDISLSHEVFDPHKPLLLHIQMELCDMTLKHLKLKLNDEFNQNESQLLQLQAYYIVSELLKDILKCVNYLHKQNIIHRDLKPENILISKGLNDNFVKITDFGLATIHEFDGQSHTKYKGTRKYTAPELFTSKKYDTKADIYSLGVICQELFNIDINSFNHSEIDHSLKNEYSKMFDKISEMMAPKKQMRPDCDQLLTEKYSWALTSTRFENIVKSKSIDIENMNEKFFSYFIQKKLNMPQSRSNSISDEI